jgi:hypothetical protein
MGIVRATNSRRGAARHHPRSRRSDRTLMTDSGVTRRMAGRRARWRFWRPRATPRNSRSLICRVTAAPARRSSPTLDHVRRALRLPGELAARLRRVRVCCGDWRRILTPSVTTYIGLTGVFLDPPYAHDLRERCYSEDHDISGDVRRGRSSTATTRRCGSRSAATKASTTCRIVGVRAVEGARRL